MEFSGVFWFVFLILLFFGGSIAGAVQHLQSRRHEFKLKLAKEQTRLVLAQAKLLEEQNRRTALEVRQAELEIERYDQRIPGRPAVPSLPVDIGDIGDIGDE